MQTSSAKHFRLYRTTHLCLVYKNIFYVLVYIGIYMSLPPVEFQRRIIMSICVCLQENDQFNSRLMETVSALECLQSIYYQVKAHQLQKGIHPVEVLHVPGTRKSGAAADLGRARFCLYFRMDKACSYDRRQPQRRQNPAYLWSVRLRLSCAKRGIEHIPLPKVSVAKATRCGTDTSEGKSM